MSPSRNHTGSPEVNAPANNGNIRPKVAPSPEEQGQGCDVASDHRERVHRTPDTLLPPMPIFKREMGGFRVRYSVRLRSQSSEHEIERGSERERLSSHRRGGCPLRVLRQGCSASRFAGRPLTEPPPTQNQEPLSVGGKAWLGASTRKPASLAGVVYRQVHSGVGISIWPNRAPGSVLRGPRAGALQRRGSKVSAVPHLPVLCRKEAVFSV